MSCAAVRTAIVTGGILAAGLFLAACGGTGFQQTWVEPTAVGKTLQRIAVVGVAADPAVRTEFEDTFARSLKLRGNDAVAGHTFIPEEIRGQIALVRQKVIDGKFDGVLVTRIVPTASAPAATGGSKLEGTLETPAAAGDGKAQLLTSLYRVPDGELLWDAMTASVRGHSLREDVASFSETMNRELGFHGLIR